MNSNPDELTLEFVLVIVVVVIGTIISVLPLFKDKCNACPYMKDKCNAWP